MTYDCTKRNGERGNALFLILIAVILFAALSYAITQSNRQGSGNVADETNLVSSSTVTQYPSSIRTGITRMLLRGSAASDLLFNPPGSFSGTTLEVFHPSGGGVAYQNPDPNTVNAMVATGTNPTQNWYFLKNKVVTNVGTATGDVVAILVDVRSGICSTINEQITGSETIPASGLTLAEITTNAANPITGSGISGQPFLCVSYTTPAGNAYYHVLIEQ